MVATEQWLAVPGWEGLYEVSDLGHARSLPRRTRSGMRGGKVLKPGPASKYGHQKVVFTNGGPGRYSFQVHQAVMLAFVGPCPEGCEVRHRDSNPRNNALANLEYATRAVNAQDRVMNGTDRNASKTHCGGCGEPYDEMNTYWYDGARQCKLCRSRRSREQWASGKR